MSEPAFSAEVYQNPYLPAGGTVVDAVLEEPGVPLPQWLAEQQLGDENSGRVVEDPADLAVLQPAQPHPVHPAPGVAEVPQHVPFGTVAQAAHQAAPPEPPPVIPGTT